MLRREKMAEDENSFGAFAFFFLFPRLLYLSLLLFVATRWISRAMIANVTS
jgi:hypothetical protein